MTSSPTCSFVGAAELGERKARRRRPSAPRGRTVGERPSTFALWLVPSVNATSIWPPAPSMTWLLVTITPSARDDEAGAGTAALPLVTGDRATGADRDDRGLDLREDALHVGRLRDRGGVARRVARLANDHRARRVVVLRRDVRRRRRSAPPTSAPTSAPATNCFHAPGRRRGRRRGAAGRRGRRARGTARTGTAHGPRRRTGRVRRRGQGADRLGGGPGCDRIGRGRRDLDRDRVGRGFRRSCVEGRGVDDHRGRIGGGVRGLGRLGRRGLVVHWLLHLRFGGFIRGVDRHVQRLSCAQGSSQS